MISNPFSGAFYLLRGLTLLTKPGIRPYVLIPLAINVVLFGLLIAFGIGQFEALMDWLLPSLPDWLQWLAWLLWLVFAVSAMLVVFFTFTLLANLVSAPFNGLLAEAVAAHLVGTNPQNGGWTTALRELPAAVGGEVRKLGYFALRGVPLLILFLIPGLNLLAPWLWLAFSAWALAIEYSDYPLGNRGLAFPAQRALLRQHRLLSLGFGGAVLLATAMPLLNLLVIPAAVAGATALWTERQRSQYSR